MIALFHAVAAALYLAAAGLLIGSLAGGRRIVPGAAAPLTAAAVAVHTVGLGLFTIRYGELPLVGLAPSLSSLAYLIGGFLLPATLFRDTRPLGLVLAPLVVVLLIAALALGIHPAPDGVPTFSGWWLGLHVVLGLVGYVCLAVAFAAGLMYLIQFRELKTKRFGRIFRLFPPLATLDRVGRVALQVGFPALTLNLALGWAWTVRFRGSFLIENPQVMWGVLSWCVFVAALLVGLGGAGRERRSALASVCGFVVVVAAYLLLGVGATGGRLFHPGV